MKAKYFLVALLCLSLSVMSGCGNGSGGGAGLNGGLTVTAAATGSVVSATATYTNPTHSNLIGVPITFVAQIGNQTFSLGTFNTNNSGTIGVVFSPPAFNSTQTITVIASSDNLSNFASITMTGRSLTVTAPPALALTTTLAGGSPFPFTIPSSASFVAITDPFVNDLSGHTIQISASVIKTNSADSFTPPTATTTNSGGTAIFPGATGTLIVPATAGGVETLTITWTVTDLTTGLTGTGITTITLTKTS